MAQFRYLVLELFRCVARHRLERVQDGSVAGAAANVAVDRLLDLCHRGGRLPLEQAAKEDKLF